MERNSSQIRRGRPRSAKNRLVVRIFDYASGGNYLHRSTRTLPASSWPRIDALIREILAESREAEARALRSAT